MRPWRVLSKLLVAILSAAFSSSLSITCALAEGPIDQVATDQGNVENLRMLAEWWGKGSHFELRGGVWLANLSRGPGAAFAADTVDIEGEAPDKAATRIGSGSGVVKEFGVELAVRGNEAFFDFLSDELFDSAEEAATEDIENEYLRDGVLMLAGELRPNLTSLLGDDAQVWLGASYGRLRGRIDDASYFVGRDGRPYFAGDKAAWSTRYVLVEGGVFFVEEGEVPALDSGQGVSLRGGIYGRYFNFSMPTVVGFSDGYVGHENVIQTATVNGAGVGFRLDLAACSVVCATVDFSMIPILGYASLDLGPWGVVPGAPAVMSLNPGVALPIPLGRALVLRPYASFRLDYLAIAFAGDVASTGGAIGDQGGLGVDQSIPDYLTWGPRFGLSLEL